MNSEEFSCKVEELRPMLYRICCMQLRDAADREDAVQEAIFKAWRKRDTLREECYFNTWFVRILINECRNIRRRKKPALPLESIGEVPLSNGSESRDLRHALQSLDVKLRICVLLHYIEGYKVHEVAKMLRISESAVKARLMRGRKRLKEMLSEEVFES